MARDYVLHPFSAQIELQIDYTRELNEQQYAAVTAPPGPSLVIAGAGSGKTRTLTYRAAFLLEQGIPAERLLLLTFTNKAAREMMRRVADLLGKELPNLWGGTFHSIANRVLRQHAPLVGFQRDFTILDREDARHLISACLADVNLDQTGTRFPKADMLAEIFSLAANTQNSVPEILESHFKKFSALASILTQVQEQYAARKKETNSMDFDDLLAQWLKLMQEQAEPREQYQRRFQFVLVDEYQDTNKLQSDLIDLLAARHHNLMVVGDDAQSIYAWRGANFLNILEFPKRYPAARIYRIETNYRSTPEILNVANAAIKANIHQFEKELAAARKTGPKPVVVVCEDAGQQAAFVAQRALELREEGVDLNRMAVLYRSHFHALELQLELTRRNIPFSITSGIRFFEQAHIKDATAYLKLAINPRDEMSFKRLVQMLPGVGPKVADKLWHCFHLQPRVDSAEPSAVIPRPRTGEAALKDPEAEFGGSPGPESQTPAAGRNQGAPSGQSPIAVALQACAEKVPKKGAVAWAQFVATIAQLEERNARAPADMLRLVVEASYEDYLKQKYANYESRLNDLEQIMVFAHQYEQVEDFLSELALLSNLEAEEGQPTERDEERLWLSTVHQAKGLEFDVVFVIMLCENQFPAALSLTTRGGEEEERRLMYVAITRARNELYLSYPLIRTGYGQTGSMVQRVSRFLTEIPAELVEEWNLRRYS